MSDVKLTDSELSQIKELHNNINNSNMDRDNKLLSVNTTIFAIVITLTSIEKNNKILLFLYLCTLLIFVTAIITGFIQTNTNSHLNKKVLDKYLENLAYIKTRGENESDLIVSANHFYALNSHIFHTSSFLAIIALAIFTILKQIM